MVAAFKSSCMDRAKQEQERMKAAGFEQFTVKQAEGLSEYIMVETECKSIEEAQKLIGNLIKKKIAACICK